MSPIRRKCRRIGLSIFRHVDIALCNLYMFWYGVLLTGFRCQASRLSTWFRCVFGMRVFILISCLSVINFDVITVSIQVMLIQRCFPRVQNEVAQYCRSQSWHRLSRSGP